jgi:hypothetical protein
MHPTVVRLRRASALALAAAMLLSACASALPAPRLRRFEPPATAQVIAHAQARMRDGVRLDTNIYLPAKDGARYPTVLVRSPYRNELNSNGSFFTRLLEEGYAVVLQHERGRYLSEGVSAMLSYAGEDGWDTLDWISAQPWSDGKVATYGCSSSAENQLKLAALGHPAHKAMIAYSAGVGVAEAGPFREQGNFWRGGVWQQGWFNYFIEATGKDWPQLPAGMTDEERQRASSVFTVDSERDDFAGTTPDDYFDEARMHLPMIDMGKALGAARTDFEEHLARGPSHPAWDDVRVTNADTIKIPGLWAEALYDISARSTVAFFEKTRQENPAGAQAILITNGEHCAFGHETADQTIGDRSIGDARFDYEARHIAWLDRWLKGKPEAAIPASPIAVYMAGANRWANFDAVPQAARDPSITFHLASGGRANTLSGDGALVASAPVSAASDTFTYDPANPVIAHGGEISGVGSDQDGTDGSFDQRAIEARPDVLVYTSEPLKEDLAVFGYITAELFVASSAPDTDFTVKLIDVAPDGTAWNIADSIQRMRYREGDNKAVFMQPGKTYRVALPPMLAANVFRKGHRVRIEVSSSNFPNYARNLNTGADPYTSTEFQTATNRVLHGPDQLSRITLPVVTLPPLVP